ncbi:MAG TPA: sensor histidine kinase [Burkholderiaceae bacterium]|nr:sensor histidine kinase [Burkholderiaceae bacterium]
MIRTPGVARTIEAPPQARAVQAMAVNAPPPEACAALDQLGDAVALIDRRAQRIRWSSGAWLALLPAMTAGTPLDALEAALPGLAAAGCIEPGAVTPRRLSLGDQQQWDAQVARFDAHHVVLRLIDRREASRALQRQLDDREQLLFTSRVISVGEMATTLAHELNQPIGATANLLRGLRSRLARRTDALETQEAAALDRALEQVMFAAKVITRIREFTHSHQPKHKKLDLVALLRASASLLDWDLRRTGAKLMLDLPAQEVPVRGDEVMLQQVIVNLMRNALDALRSDPPDEPKVTLQLTLRHGEAEVQVRDNGCGLGDDAAAKLFVPFASSKPSGMGIGLSICRSFVELHQGRLWFSRNADRGATFHVSLPRPAGRSESTVV